MKHVYFFSKGLTDGDRTQSALLGGKGANLAEMTRLGVPVPPGFTITTEVCRHHLITHEMPEGTDAQVEDAIRRLERLSGKKFGGAEDPLLVSVRSGGAVSMPGMMDTILNLGLNDETVEGLARVSGNAAFAYDSYRRFLQMYSDVVLELDHDAFESILGEARRQAGVETDYELEGDALRSVVRGYRELIDRESEAPFPQDPEEQLWGAIEAVFRSWRNPRAQAYRKTYGIPHDLGTAVNVQTMVYGNRGSDSGTGVAFTRNAADGEPKLFGEFLINAQGEDVVAGTRDPLSIDQMREYLPRSFDQLKETAERLEKHYREMQDLEFTVEQGTLYLLQTRTGKRTARAAVRIAVDMANEGLITRQEAVLRVEPERLEQVLHPMVDPSADYTPLAEGNPASPGAASGRVVLSAKEAVERAREDDPVILLRTETSPDDFEGMVAAVAIVTSRGGKSSHAAVVARGMGKCCVVGTKELEIDEEAGEIRARGRTVRRGEWITVDGASGEIIEGRIPTVKPEPGADFHELMGWADECRRLRVRTNADNPADAATARGFGAEGIGLCRTEHMFFGDERIDAVREMILADDKSGRAAALAKLLPMQRSDFVGIFRAMDGLPVTIRLLDPPLHEFLPSERDEIERLALGLGRPEAELEAAVARLHEANPMLGHRGCRLGYSHPEITAMQARAIIEAALDVAEDGVDVRPEIMVPLVGHLDEFDNQKAIIDAVAREVFAERDRRVDYLVGTMIELPRACLTAGAIAGPAEFFSFGTNDLTQTTLGLSRDDAGSFLPLYVEAGVYARDPFQSIDTEGVGRLMALAVSEGREARPSLKIGICGEHGGDPPSVEFCHALGMDYVSCSPFRVPVARLAAAHAALKEQGADGKMERT
ncbi:MAG: pyruvate, phosphate dikinase [Candidatus Palauibacterales bacterium]|nr:pyruvate, phosphate dikinase [Candidatus Palauibacterales bacterium]